MMPKSLQDQMSDSSPEMDVNETLSDEWLMDAYNAGNPSAFDVLVHRYERELYSYIRRVVIDPGLAEDVFQNTFLQVHQKRHMYQQGRPVRPWLYTIATNQAIDALRRHQRHRRTKLEADLRRPGSETDFDHLKGNSIDPLDNSERREQWEAVRSAVNSLPEPYRAVLVLGYYQGMKYKEIAEILSIPVGTVKSRLHAAITRLGEAWKNLGFGEE